ncbi:MAG TPA: Xaa-Pro peptidase family protein [Candidatus Binatia bacterium]|nr:Xaa-Pro peptidase family protein [Candidatus Binatia bacterium]
MLVNEKRLQDRMDELGLDGIVAATLPNVHYFAGFWSLALSGFPYEGQCYAVVTRDEPTCPIVVSSTVELDQVQDGIAAGFPVKDTVNFGTFYREGPFLDVELSDEEKHLKSIAMERDPLGGPLPGLIAALKQLGLAGKKVGLDELGLRRDVYEGVQEKMPQTTFVNASALLRWVRKVKTPEEIRRLREVVKITERAILAATAIARRGVTEVEVAREFERSIVSQGGRPQFSLIRFGRNAVAGQRVHSRTELQEGDVIWFDTGALYDGYWSDIARGFSLGEPHKRAAEIYQAMVSGEESGIAQTKVGMTGGELFDITMQAARDAGAPHYRRHHVGHGIGSEVYEPPLLAPNNRDVIEAGSVVNIETPYYEFGLGGLHVEDPFVVHADGNHELLTTLPRTLQVLPT